MLRASFAPAILRSAGVSGRSSGIAAARNRGQCFSVIANFLPMPGFQDSSPGPIRMFRPELPIAGAGGGELWFR